MRPSMRRCSGKCSSTFRTTWRRCKRSRVSFARRGCSPFPCRPIPRASGRATVGRDTCGATAGTCSSARAREAAFPSGAAWDGAFRSPLSTIDTSMSDASTGTARPRRGAGSALRSPSSPRSSRSTAFSSGSSAALSVISSWRRVASARALLWIAIVVYAAGFSALSTLRHLAFNTGRFDLGNMVQAVWATSSGHPLAITDLHGEQISRLAAHVDPILVLFAPLWWVWPSPSMLFAVQATAIALGALPVFWLAQKHLGSERAAFGFALAYLLYPAVQWQTLNEFHPVALATPLLLFALWYLDEDRLWAFAAFGVAAALCKEEIPLV